MSTPPSETDQALAGKVVAVPESRQLDVLANLLERRGAAVLRCPLVGIVDSPDEPGVLGWIERLIATPTDLAVFYTGEGIQRLVGVAQRAQRAEPFIAALARTPKLTRGPKPRRALKTLGLEPEHPAAAPTTAGMIETARRLETPLRRVALQLYNEDQDRELVEHFERRGARVDCVAPYVYARAADDERVAALIDELASGNVDAIAFTSKAQLQRLIDLAAKRQLEPALRSGLARTRVAAIGPVVAADLTDAGVRVDTMPAESYSMKPLVTSLCELLAGPR
ncbi:MAG TPA: uroporphyrinogen-III synthase [Gammaproteobacteria bacterium]|nr:uroporphyrinogen-III synthase [Gammaproteobacteria bacterium]